VRLLAEDDARVARQVRDVRRLHELDNIFVSEDVLLAESLCRREVSALQSLCAEGCDGPLVLSGEILGFVRVGLATQGCHDTLALLEELGCVMVDQQLLFGVEHACLPMDVQIELLEHRTQQVVVQPLADLGVFSTRIPTLRVASLASGRCRGRSLRRRELLPVPLQLVAASAALSPAIVALCISCRLSRRRGLLGWRGWAIVVLLRLLSSLGFRLLSSRTVLRNHWLLCYIQLQIRNHVHWAIILRVYLFAVVCYLGMCLAQRSLRFLRSAL